MNPQVLIDTSIWIEYFRARNHEVVQTVKDLIVNKQVLLCGIVLSELLAGLKNMKDREILNQTMDALEYREVSIKTWILAGNISNDLRRQGIVIPISDLILAAIAIENNCEIFTLDSHFNHIPTLKRFKSEIT